MSCTVAMSISSAGQETLRFTHLNINEAIDKLGYVGPIVHSTPGFVEATDESTL